MDKKHNCHDCKFNGGRAPFSGHHIMCNVAGDSLGDKARAAVVFMAGAIIELTEKETGRKYPAIEFNPHGVQKGYCFWPADFDPIWVNVCHLYISNKDNGQDLSNRSDGTKLPEPSTSLQPGSGEGGDSVPVSGT